MREIATSLNGHRIGPSIRGQARSFLPHTAHQRGLARASQSPNRLAGEKFGLRCGCVRPNGTVVASQAFVSRPYAELVELHAAIAHDAALVA